MPFVFLTLLCLSYLHCLWPPFYRSHYSISLNSIEVGNSVLQLSSGAFDSGDDKGVIVDSGTTLVYLPGSVYKPLISEVNYKLFSFCIVEKKYVYFYYKVSEHFVFFFGQILASHPELTLHKVQDSFTCFRYYDR